MKDLYVIIQAGGRGSRLRHHTWNKPKCLLSVRGKTLLYRIFGAFAPANAKFIVIGDYLFERMASYLEVSPPPCDVRLIKSDQTGTLAGIDKAISMVPPESPVLIVWSDLILNELPELPESPHPVVGITSAFTCRWRIGEDGKLRESPTSSDGIPGIFYFPMAKMMPVPPPAGEFVKWFQSAIPAFSTLDCPNIEEVGDFSVIEESNDRSGYCRFFNEITIEGDRVTKRVIEPQFLEVHHNEVAWYKTAASLGFRRVPRVYSEDPLVLERIRGQHAYLMNDLSDREKRAVLADYVDSLESLHSSGQQPNDPEDVVGVYLKKTQSRVAEVCKLIPNVSKDSITINGLKCRNIFADRYSDVLPEITAKLQPACFRPIHGDPTFSNTIVDQNLRVWFIDPRGYFARKGIYGDPRYDLAKLYYSSVGGYDLFNRRKFKLHVDDLTAEVLMETPSFSRVAEDFFKEEFSGDMSNIKALHGLLWLSLCGYVKDDVDSLIAAYYLGLYWIERANNNL
jgi:hypothetical protein